MIGRKMFLKIANSKAFSAADTRILLSTTFLLLAFSECCLPQTVYRSAFDVAFSPAGRTMAVSDRTARRLSLIEVATGEVLREIRLRGKPSGVSWSADGSRVYVAECAAGSIAEVDSSGKVSRRLAVGPWPVGIGLARKRNWLLAAHSATGAVSAVRLDSGRAEGR